jgi:hypothetical protein
VPERLEIPFAAVRGFYDPSVNFELEFDVKMDAAAEPAAKTPKPPAEITKAPVAAKKADAKKKLVEPVKDAKDAPADATPAAAKGADVVSLDAFRKK